MAGIGNFRRDDPVFIAFCLSLQDFTAEKDAEGYRIFIWYRPFVPIIMCRYCLEMPAPYVCEDCDCTYYCNIECWDADQNMHERECRIARDRAGEPRIVNRRG